MRHYLLALSLGLLSLTAQAEVIDIDNAELDRLIKSGVPVIDIRTQGEWEESGIIGGSKLNTFFDEKGKADPAAWLEKVKPFAKPDQPVILICRSGNRTKPASQFLSQQAGYAKVYNVKNGIKSWVKDGGTLTPAAQTLASCRATKTC
jgi:rhodanese-related sulfurtransferase